MSSSSTATLNGVPVVFSSPKVAGSLVQGQWNNNQLVAIKVLQETVDLDGLLSRLQLWKTLNHLHVAQIIDAGDVDGGELVVVLPLFPAGNIRQYLDLYPNLGRPKLIYEIGLGMQYLHSQGIVHGSLRPSNVLISDEGNPVLSDYGLIELQPSTSQDAQRYWSPEAWKGTISKPSDVYAFAMTAFEIFTSSPPWGYLSEKHIYQLVVYEDTRPDRPDQHLELRVGLTESMWGLMNESWDKEPRLRPTFDIILRVWGAQILSPSNIGYPGLSRSQSIPSPSSPTYGHHSFGHHHRAAHSIDDISSIHSYSSGPPAYETEFPHLMPQNNNQLPPPPVPSTSYAYTSMLPPSVAPLVASSYTTSPSPPPPPPPPLLPGLEPIRPLQIRTRRGSSPRRTQSALSPTTTSTRLAQFGRMPPEIDQPPEEIRVYGSPIASRSMTSLTSPPSQLPPVPNTVASWREQMLASMSLEPTQAGESSRPNSRNELLPPPQSQPQPQCQSASRPPSRNTTDRPPSRNEGVIERPGSRASNRRAASREPSERSGGGDVKRAESPFGRLRVTNANASSSSSSATGTLSKHLSNASSFKSISSYNLRPSVINTFSGSNTTTPMGTPLGGRFPEESEGRRRISERESSMSGYGRRPATSGGYSSSPPSSLAFKPMALPEEQSPDEEPRYDLPPQSMFDFVGGGGGTLPPGAASHHNPHHPHHPHHQHFPSSPGWDVQSVMSENTRANLNLSRVNGGSASASLAASTNAVALVSSLQNAINNTGTLSSPLEFGSAPLSDDGSLFDDPAADCNSSGGGSGNPEEEVDFALIKIHGLATQSEKDAQRLVTAGLVPVLLGLVETRFRAAKDAKRKGGEMLFFGGGGGGKGLEMVLITLGMIAYDSITANIIFRTGTISTLIDIFSSFSASSTIEEEAAQREQIATLALWCLNRICRSAEIANGLIKADLVGMLISKTLRIGFAHSNLIGRYGAWLLGNLMFSDSIVDHLEIKYGVVNEVVDYLRRVVGRSASSSSNVNSNLSTGGGTGVAPPSPEDVSAALYPLARLSRTMKLSKALTIGVSKSPSDMGVILLLSSILSTSTDPALLGWACRTVGCLIRPNSAEVARAMLDGGIGTGLSRVPRVLTTEEALGIVVSPSFPSSITPSTSNNTKPPAPLASFAFAISRFSCAEWGAGIRKRLVEETVVDSLLSALRSASDEPCPEVHIELALAVSFLGDVGGKEIRKEVVRAGGIDILRQVAEQAKSRLGSGQGQAAEQALAERIIKVCGMAITSITGNIWSRNAASAKTAMTHDWTGGCPEYQPPCPFSIDIQADDYYADDDD